MLHQGENPWVFTYPFWDLKNVPWKRFLHGAMSWVAACIKIRCSPFLFVEPTNSRDLPGFFRGFPPSDVALVIVPLVGWNDRQPLFFFGPKGVNPKTAACSRFFEMKLLQDHWMFVNTPLACGCFFLFDFLPFVFVLSFTGIFKGPKKNVQKKGQQKCCVEDQGCRFVPIRHFRKQSATDGTDMDVNIGFQGLAAYGFRAKSTPRKINMVHLQITHEKQGKWSSKPPFLEFHVNFQGCTTKMWSFHWWKSSALHHGNHGKNPRRGTPPFGSVLH